MTLKGRVAATIQSSDELVLTELIFNSGFKVCLPAYCMLMLYAHAHLASSVPSSAVTQAGRTGAVTLRGHLTGAAQALNEPTLTPSPRYVWMSKRGAQM